MQLTEFPVISMRDVSGGQMSAVEDSLIPDGNCRLTLNFRYDKLGKAVQRNGYAKVGGTISLGTSPDGLTHFMSVDGTRNRLVAAYGGTNYAWDGTAWTDQGGAYSAGTKVRYAKLIDRVFMVGGGTSTKSWSGILSENFGNAQLSGAPSGSLILDYKSKLHIAGNTSFPDRLYRSSVPDTSGNITWTSTDWLDVNPADGDNITALAKTGTLMLIFKRNHIYRWNGNATDAEPVINVGAVSQEAVANVNGTVFFFSPHGIFATDGATPVEISRPIRDLIEAIPSSSYDSLAAYADGDRFGLYCGTVTVNSRTFANLCLEYDTNVRTWQPHTLANTFKVFANARNASGADYLAGAMTSFVENMFTGNDDDSAAINFERETKKMEFDHFLTTKEVNDVVFYLKGGTGAVFEALPENGEAVRLGTAEGLINVAKGKSVRGNRISFRISGANKSTPAEWMGFEITKSRSLGLIARN